MTVSGVGSDDKYVDVQTPLGGVTQESLTLWDPDEMASIYINMCCIVFLPASQAVSLISVILFKRNPRLDSSCLYFTKSQVKPLMYAYIGIKAIRNISYYLVLEHQDPKNTSKCYFNQGRSCYISAVLLTREAWSPCVTNGSGKANHVAHKISRIF